MAVPLCCSLELPARSMFFVDGPNNWSILMVKDLHPSVDKFCLSLTTLPSIPLTFWGVLEAACP